MFPLPPEFRKRTEFELGVRGGCKVFPGFFFPENEVIDKRILKIGIPSLLCVAMSFFAGAWLLRDFWFDEALTVLNFALLPSAGAIYRSYVIPNNQIVYTWMLHFWIGLQPENVAPDLWMRLLSFFLGLGTLIALFSFFRVRLGKWNLAVGLAALGCSPPFLLYATAVRGYMAGAFFVVLTLHFALNFSVFGRVRDGVLYFIGALLTLGTIPSNLVALAGVGLYVLPCCGTKFYRRPRFWYLAAAPFLAGLLFYAPIADGFLRVARLGEGWREPFGVLQALLAAVIGSFGMLLLPGVAVCIRGVRKCFFRLRSVRIAIWLLPVPAVLLLPVAPFPRVFFPLFMLFVLLLVGGVRDLSALNCRLRRRWHPVFWYGGLLLLVFGWAAVFQLPALRSEFSRRCGGTGRDDFFYPYYLRPAHSPFGTARELAKIPAGKRPDFVYLSFASDPWPLMFYSRLNGFDPKEFLFDGPRGRVSFLPTGSIVILNVFEDPTGITQRFGGVLRPLFVHAGHRVLRWFP